MFMNALINSFQFFAIYSNKKDTWRYIAISSGRKLGDGGKHAHTHAYTYINVASL